MRHILTVTIILFTFSVTAQHGGWTKPKGTGYYKLFQWWQVADQHFVKGTLTDPNATRGTFITSIYAEYGITDRITGIAYLPLFARTYQNDQVNIIGQVIPGQEGSFNNGIGDVNLSLKYGITKPSSKFVTAAILTLGIPTGESTGGSDGSFQTGDGEFNQLLTIDVSRSFKIGSLGSYGNVYGGFNNRTNRLSDEVRFGGEVGFNVKKDLLWFIAKLDVVNSLENGDAIVQSASLFGNNTEYSSVTFEGAYYLNNKVGVSLSYATAFAGSIIYASPSYSVGVFLDIK